MKSKTDFIYHEDKALPNNCKMPSVSPNFSEMLKGEKGVHLELTLAMCMINERRNKHFLNPYYVTNTGNNHHATDLIPSLGKFILSLPVTLHIHPVHFSI